VSSVSADSGVRHVSSRWLRVHAFLLSVQVFVKNGQYTYIVLSWYSPFHRASGNAIVVICHAI